MPTAPSELLEPRLERAIGLLNSRKANCVRRRVKMVDDWPNRTPGIASAVKMVGSRSQRLQPGILLKFRQILLHAIRVSRLQILVQLLQLFLKLLVLVLNAFCDSCIEKT